MVQENNRYDLANIKYSCTSYVHTHCITEENKNRGIIIADNKGKHMIMLGVENYLLQIPLPTIIQARFKMWEISSAS